MATAYEDWASERSPVDWDAPVIDLDALLDRQRRGVIVGGQHYDFKDHDELSLVDQENLRRLFVRIYELENAPGADDTGLLRDRDNVLLQRLDRRCCQIALHEVTDTAIEQWSPAQRNAIRNVFFRSFDVTPYTGRLFARWLHQINQARQQADAMQERVEAMTTTQPTPTDSSSPPSTDKPKRGKRSPQASASTTAAA